MSEVKSPSEKLAGLLNLTGRIQELGLGDDDGKEPIDAPKQSTIAHDIPWLFCEPPVLQDTLETASSVAQDKVLEACRKYLSGEVTEIHDLNSHGIPTLQRDAHLEFILDNLEEYPAPYQAMDAARAWIVYWALAALSHLGEPVTPYRDRALQTFIPIQNPDGGFGPITSHAAPTYAAVLSLAMVGGLDAVNRRSMWHWLGAMKQPDGSFSVALGGEIDMRGAYCAMTVLTLLNLPRELPPSAPARAAGLTSFTDNLGAWIAASQTYEGGVGAAPDNEAHGAYAFCALACLCMLDAPHRAVPAWLDVDALADWLSARQNAPEAGFSGRTNKLVDACYSHWIGGCWPLLTAAMRRSKALHSREAVVRYSLAASQVGKGGMRDKPGVKPDGYHTNYSLAGLSSAQNTWRYEDAGGGDGFEDLDAPWRWVPSAPGAEEMAELAFDEHDRLAFVHPLFVIPPEAVERTRAQFKDVVGF